MPDDAGLPHRTVHQMIGGERMRDLLKHYGGALQTAELFVLSAIRLWCRAGADGSRADRPGAGGPGAGGPGADGPCRRALVRNGFHAVNLTCDHYAAFAQLMTAITSARALTTAAAGCAPLQHDEAWLLECFALMQHHRSSESTELLAVLLPAAAVRVAAEALDGLAAALAGVGLHLRIRSPVRPAIHPAALWRHTLSRRVH